MGIVRFIVALSFAAVLCACESPRAALEERDVQLAAQQVESIANEADWLARQLGERSVSKNMAWVHQQALAQDAVKALRDLAKPVPPEMRESHARILQLSAQLQSQLGRIAAAAKDAGELDSVRHELEAVARAAHPLAGHA